MQDPKGDLFDISYINRNRRDRARDGIFIGSVVASYVSSIFIIAALSVFLPWQLVIPAAAAVLVLTWYFIPKLLVKLHQHILNKVVYVYEVTKEFFLKKYPYVDDRHWQPFPDTVWVLPLSSTTKRGAKEEVRHRSGCTFILFVPLNFPYI